MNNLNKSEDTPINLLPERKKRTLKPIPRRLYYLGYLAMLIAAIMLAVVYGMLRHIG